MPERSQLALKRAQNWLQSAQRGKEDQRWDDCVYNAQMAAEQAIKALFLKLGIYYKRIHDVSDTFRQMTEKEDLPKTFREQIPKIADRMEELTEQRNLAGYGFEEGINPDYFQEYAPIALEWATDIVRTVRKVLQNL
ncbi:MAG: HEPN domain-containing protein [Candidatus Heimdallarchaeota archaeon]|nr:MAG: HEPN domain-containing protein [Candidatus Heimdallarchaeota archaeon]